MKIITKHQLNVINAQKEWDRCIIRPNIDLIKKKYNVKHRLKKISNKFTIEFY